MANKGRVLNKRIGLFGGTFNPIHYGHIKMAEAARKEYKLDIVYFIPCGTPPHKLKKDLLPAKKRFDLLKEAIKGEKYFKVLDVEIKKKTKAYTINTVKQFLGIYSNKSLKIQLYFLIGKDEFENLHTWKNFKELAKMVTFLVLPRKSKKTKEKKSLKTKIPSLKFKFVHTKPIDISSTEIRKKM